jgi:sugar lactone lactonase YvrE
MREVPGTPVCDLGEGPFWDAATGSLVFVDLLAGLVHLLDVRAGRCRTVDIGLPVSAVLPAGENWLLVVENGFRLCDPAWKTLWSHEVFERPTPVRMNDAACDPHGRLYAGTLAYDGTDGLGALYRLDADGSCRQVAENLGISNGIAWSPDRAVMYHVDSAARVIYAREYDERTGQLGAAPVFYAHQDDAQPDGIAVDADGGLWVALWDGGRVIRLDSTGTLTDEVAVPAPRTTSVAFGGDDLRTLYVTSAHTEPDPSSGKVFCFTTEVPGRPVHGWGGGR